jgi:phospho-N-acetylmuramoyl-pentapeptide-transferase
MLYSYLASLSLALFDSYFLQVIFRLSFIFLTAFLIAYLGIKFFICFIHKKQNFYQPIRDDGPQNHLNDKQKTPTMGGLFIVLGFSLLISKIIMC